ncbi:hypothetical protein C2G38_2187136 [Gigaspora rosea]|uniref:Uncharacterized protein n=1 Tax=Gigaspora rosea TaxID=44941 RepID=A0A397V643_9GLOM|nr:hypothetical protein C2G38_2187136 [Gigaspora rosea]
MNTQVEIPKVQKRKFNEQYNFSKKKLKTSIESKMIKRANEVKNIHFLTLVLNCFDNPFIFFHFFDYCLDRWNFYKPTPIFRTRANYNFCEYLVDELEPLVDFSVVEGSEFKLCSDCTIKKKEALFNSVHRLKDSIYRKKIEIKFTDFFYNDVIRIVIRNLYNILNEQDIYIEKYGGHVKNYDFPKNLLYNRDFSYYKKGKENPYAELEHASIKTQHLVGLDIFGDLEKRIKK